MRDRAANRNRTDGSPRDIVVVRDRLRKMLSADAVVVAVGLIIFLLFLWLLISTYFPAGTGILNDLKATTNSEQNRRSGKTLSFENEREGRVIAELVDFRRDVKIRPAEAPNWSAARRGNSFRFHDSLQTMSRSSAIISLQDAGRLTVGPNSLIVFRAENQNVILPDQTTTMVLMDGMVGAKLSMESEAVRNLEFGIPGGIVRLLGGTKSGDDLKFTLSVNPDKSSSLALYGGQAEVTAGGRTVRLGPNEGITIGDDGVLLNARALPSTPSTNLPENGREVRFRNLAPTVEFKWQQVSRASEYYFELARDAGFTDIVADSRLPLTKMSHQNLSAGRYFWRVTALDGWHRSRPSNVSSVNLVRDLQAPALIVEPVATVPGQLQAVVSGHAEIGSQIFVQGERAGESNNGRFRHVVKLNAGANLITVEAIDQVGNVSYATQLTHTHPLPNGSD